MILFWKATAGVLIAVILTLLLGKQGKEFSLILGMGVCCMVCAIALTYLEPVLEFLQDLRGMGELNGDILTSLLKAAGIALVTELAVMICNDSGSAALGKGIQLLGTAVILCLCLPVFRSVLELLQKLLGEL